MRTPVFFKPMYMYDRSSGFIHLKCRLGAARLIYKLSYQPDSESECDSKDAVPFTNAITHRHWRSGTLILAPLT